MTVRYTATFLRQLNRLARKYRRIRHDLGTVITQLLAGQTPGDQVQGTGYPVYKVRVRNTDAQRGTRGGYRVIYYIADADADADAADVLLLTVYSKTEQDDIDTATITRLIDDAKRP